MNRNFAINVTKNIICSCATIRNVCTLTILMFSVCTFSQSGSITQVENSELMHIQFVKKIGLNLKSTIQSQQEFKEVPIGGEIQEPALPQSNGIINYTVEDIPMKAITPVLGRNFKGNQMHNGTPPDNSMAISNSGYIVSFDNSSVEYRTENGDSLAHQVELYTFIDSVTTSEFLFDPKVIYDNEANRFIAVLVHRDNIIDISQILVAFSVSDDPTLGWNLYEFFADTLFTNAWFDRPNIGINDEDLFISGGMFSDGADLNIGNTTFQIIKDNGYTGSSSLICKVWKDILRPDGNIATGMHPMSYGQTGSYGPGIYLVSNNWSGGDSVYMHHITENCSSFPTTVITTSHLTDSYASPPLGIQPASASLRTGNCRVLDGFFLNDRCHFVFPIIQNGYPAIRYQRINVVNNSTVWSSRGLASQEYAYAYPCISSFGIDDVSNDVMIGYLRTSPSVYPSVAVLNYDGSNWSSTTIVQLGNAIVDLTPDSLSTTERWGDYISMQRRYNASEPTVWMIGHYGDSLNDYGEQYGWTSWIAEIGDVGVGIDENEFSFSDQCYIYPNPAFNTLHINQVVNDEFVQIQLVNSEGRVVFDQMIGGSTYINIPSLDNGMYFVRLFNKSNNIRHDKVVILN